MLKILKNHLINVAELRTFVGDGPAEKSVKKVEKRKDEAWRELLMPTLHKSLKKLFLHPISYLFVEDGLIVPFLVLLSDSLEISSDSHRI